LGVQLWELVPQSFRPVHKPPVGGPQGLDEGVEGIVLPPVPAELGVHPVESVVPLPGPTLQLLPPADKAREYRSGKVQTWKKQEQRDYKTRREATNLEDAPRGTSVDPQRLVQRPVGRGAVVAEFLP
jgi:hypothetical protein